MDARDAKAIADEYNSNEEKKVNESIASAVKLAISKIKEAADRGLYQIELSDSLISPNVTKPSTKGVFILEKVVAILKNQYGYKIVMNDNLPGLVCTVKWK